MAEGGLLDFFKSPEGQGLLAAGFGALAGRGTRAQAIGQGGLAGLLAYGKAGEMQADQARQKEQDAWMRTQRDWMTQDRARADSDRQSREGFLNTAFTPAPLLQPSQAPQDIKNTNPYADPYFIFGAAKSAGVPGIDQVPMGVRTVNPFDAMRAKFSPEESMQLQAMTAPKKPNLQTFKSGDVVRNMDTGEVVYQAPEKPAELPSAIREYQFAKEQGYKGTYEQWAMAQKRAGASSVAINMGQKGLENEFKLRDGFKGEPVYKAHQEMQAAYGQIKQSLAQASPAGDLAGATKIMKLLDPGSVVRESELGMAMAASGALDRLQYYAQNVVNGTKLTPSQRKDFQTLADKLYGESVNQYNAKRSEYERLGSDYGLNAGRAIGPAATAGAPKQTKPSVSNW